MGRRVGTWGLAVLFSAACAEGEIEEGTSFGNVTYPMMTSPAMTTAAADDGSGSDATGSEENSSDASTAAVAESSTGGSGPPPGDSTSGPPPATDSGGMDNGMQPADGMYADCLTAAVCVGLNTCITILDTMDMPIDGFCTNNACMTPATDCDMTPGGTAVPFCMDVTLNGRPDTVCALDCAGGATCPGGMMCWDLGGTSVCA